MDYDGLSAISAVTIENRLNGDEWYDLNGRRYSGLPMQKGLYINNGIKVTMFAVGNAKQPIGDSP